MSKSHILKVSWFFIFCLIFALQLPLRSSAAEKFPVGLSLQYEIESRSGFYSDSYTKSYDFVRWTDGAKTTVELQVDSDATVVAYPSGSVVVLAGIPLWTDVSHWTSGSMSFNGRTYEVSRSSRNGYQTWYLHASVEGPGDFDAEYWNIHYEVNFGFLVFYGNIEFRSLSTSELTANLEESNLKSFMFLGGILNTPYITSLLLTCIIVELGVICNQLRKRSSWSKDNDDQ